jgi:hypothetical protein
MLWVDHESYFGPDRRKRNALHLYERRRVNCAGPPPPLRTALRRFRMKVLDVSEENAPAFIAHMRGLALLAQIQDEVEAAEALSGFASIADHNRAKGRDIRPSLYYALDQAETMVRGNAEARVQSG